MSERSAVELGERVRDRVTGFTGIATAHVRYLSGSEQWCVQPPVAADGKHQDALYFNADRLEKVDDGVRVGFQAQAPRALPSAFRNGPPIR